ncbi:hypothetical protein C8Q76DRAFT_853265 [Earliella scabrosa]|nr:hypothetical protein C8Q76DRAFT_853265 [Earliella scabrosa]
MATVYDRSLLDVDRQRVVAQVTVTGSGTLSTVSGSPNIFHWRLYLCLAPFQSIPPTTTQPSQSVLIDMIPANPPTGCMMIASKQDPGSRARVKIELQIATTGSPTVQQIIDLFLAKGMHRYNFDATGSGCLWWVWTGLGYLEQNRLVQAGATEMLRQFHQEQSRLHPERHPVPIRQGRFYWLVTKAFESTEANATPLAPKHWCSLALLEDCCTLAKIIYDITNGMH